MNEQKIQTPKAGQPIEAAWAKSLTEKANALNIVGGNGITVSQNGNGITISQIDKQGTKQAPPQLFECRWRVVDGETRLYAYIGKNNANTIVFRNSKPCKAASAISITDDWALVAGVTPSSYWPAYVCVRILSTPEPESGGVEHTWNLMSMDRFMRDNLDGNPEQMSGTSYTYIASYIGGVLRQWQVGEIVTWYIYPDSQYPYHIKRFNSASLDHVETEAGQDVYQLYEFRTIDNQMSVGSMSTAITNPGTDNGRKYKGLDFVMRDWHANSKTANLRYAAIEDVFAAMGEALADPPSGAPDDNPFYGWETWLEIWISEHIEEYCGWGDIEYWIENIFEEGDKKYWHQGGNTDTCWGAAIGDDSGTPAIDLAGRTLLRGTGIKSVDWADCLMWDDTEKKSIDWDSRLLHDAEGIKTVDWNNCQAFAAYNGWLSIDWGAMQLYSHVLENNPVKSLDWSACTTYDADGNTTMSWRVRQLREPWSVASDGSFSTPNLTLNGTTFTGATEISVITAIDFATSATSSTNIWALTT